MADNTISSKLELDGEKEYKAALNDAYRELRVLRSELKAETAELGRNASEQDKARTKMKSLQSQIQQQEKIVQTLTKAFEDSKKEYGDHQEVQDKWEEKLNKARAALAEMKNQLEDSQSALQDFTREMEDVSKGSDDAVQTVVSFNDCLKSISGIVSGVGSALSGIFSSSVETMKEMVSEMWELMGQAYAAAGNWKDIQAMYGGSLDSIQEVFRGAGIMGVDVGTITSGIEKLTQNTHAGNADTLAALEQLHIEESDYNSHWEYFVDVMEQLSMRENGTELAGKIFGDKKGFGINLLLDQWQELKNAYQEDIQETGLDLSAPEIDKLDEVGKTITRIQGDWNEIKVSVGAKLSEILNMDENATNTLNLLHDIAALFSGEGDRKELVMKLDNDLNTLLTSISDGLGNFSEFLSELGGDLQQSENPLVRFVGQLISSLGDILDWISENSDMIVSWLEKLLPVMGANTISEAATGMGLGEWLTTTLGGIFDIVAISKLGSAFGGSAATAITGTAESFGSGIGAALLKAVPLLAGLAVLFDTSNHGDDSMFDANGNYIDEYAEQGAKNFQEYEEKWGFLRNPENNKFYLAGNQIEALQNYWDIYRNPDIDPQEKRDAFDELNSLFYGRPMGALGIMSGWGDLDLNTEDVPDELLGIQRVTEELQDTIEEMNDDDEDVHIWDLLEGKLDTLVKGQTDKYTGNTEETRNLEAKVQVHSHLYLDGDQIMEVVNERVVGGMDFHVMG